MEPDVLTGAEGLRALYLTGNAIDHVSPRALEQASDLDTLHLGGNKLTEVPTEALSKTGNLRDLRLSGNSIRWVGPNAFRTLERSLKELYLDNMGLEKVSELWQPKPALQLHLLPKKQNISPSYLTVFFDVISCTLDVTELPGRSGFRAEKSLSGGQPAGGGA